jgi:hypothetical protein
MAKSDTRSLNEIQRETRQARATLLETVEQLHNAVSDRVKPASIKAEMAGYARSRAWELLDDASRAARENPLQAAAVFGGLAYPLVRLARAIPVPVWLVGAGLLVARSETVAQGVTALKEKVGDAGKAASGVKDTLGSASDQVNEARERAGSAVASASEKVGDLAASAGASLREATEKVTDAAGQMSASASETASEAAGKVASLSQDGVQSANTSLRETAHVTSETASDAGGRAISAVFRTLGEHPLLVAGVGLLVGGVIAGALPRSELEGELMGEASRSARQRAQAAADRGIGAVSDAAREGVRRAAREAEAEGLEAEGVGESVHDVGQRVRHVAEAAVTTAFEPPEENEQSSVDGGRENG